MTTWGRIPFFLSHWFDLLNALNITSLKYFYKDFLNYQPVLHDWCNKGCGMCHPVCGMVHIKEPLLLIGKSSPCGGSGFHLSGPLPYV